MRTLWQSRTLRMLLGVAVGAAISTLGPRADAEPQGDPPAEPGAANVCLAAYEEAQVTRKHNDLLSSRRALRTCAAAGCMEAVRDDCLLWTTQNEELIPSIVVEAKVDNVVEPDVSVSMDGKTLAEKCDGTPIEINPGLHAFVFARVGRPNIEQKLIIRAGEKSRLLPIAWQSGPPPAGPARHGTVLKTRPIPAAFYVFGVAGLAGFGTFAGLALSGKSLQHNLEKSCSPRCTDAEVSPLHTRYLGADIALGVGAASLVTSAILFFTRPAQEVNVGVVRPIVDVRPMNGGASIVWSQSF